MDFVSCDSEGCFSLLGLLTVEDRRGILKLLLSRFDVHACTYRLVERVSHDLLS